MTTEGRESDTGILRRGERSMLKRGALFASTVKETTGETNAHLMTL